jgi:hypothetical protein
MVSKRKIKGRCICVYRKKDGIIFIGTSVSGIADEMGLNMHTLYRTVSIAENSVTHKYTGTHYDIYFSDHFIKGKPRGGNYPKFDGNKQLNLTNPNDK